jgi:hypothetical protein
MTAEGKLIRNLNTHLPVKRRTLSSLLEEDKPRIIGRDGSSHRFKKGELSEIASMVPGKYHDKVKLPIYIEFVPEYGRGTAMIRGYVHCEIVQSILEKKKEKMEKLMIYRPDIMRLRRKLPTTTQYAFFMTIDEDRV